MPHTRLRPPRMHQVAPTRQRILYELPTPTHRILLKVPPRIPMRQCRIMHPTYRLRRVMCLPHSNPLEVRPRRRRRTMLTNPLRINHRRPQVRLGSLSTDMLLWVAPHSNRPFLLRPSPPRLLRCTVRKQRTHTTLPFPRQSPGISRLLLGWARQQSDNKRILSTIRLTPPTRRPPPHTLATHSL